MSQNPVTLKVATPYARALFDYSLQQNVLHQITADFHNLAQFLEKTPELVEYLNNPVVSSAAKYEVLSKTIKSKLNKETFNFLGVLVYRDRINILQSVITSYLNLVYQTAAIRMIEVVTPLALGGGQKRTLIKKLKELTNAREIRLVLTLDPTLIGGLVVKTESKILDFSVKSQLQNLAKHLDTVLEI